MAVTRKQEIDSLLSTERLQHARDGVYVRLVCHACVRESAASAVEGVLRNAREVAVCQDSNVADFIIYVGDRHPRDVDVGRPGREQRHNSPGKQDGKYGFN
jgi:hypothetical protein